MNSRILIIISLIIFTITGCSQKEEDAVEKSVPVKVYIVKSESISKYIRATGSISGDEDVILYSKTSERIEKLNVNPGQSVKKNQILVEQKNEILKQGLDMANAALKSAEAQLKQSDQDFERISKLNSEKL